MNPSDFVKKLKDFLETDEGKLYIQNKKDEFEREYRWRRNQINRLNRITDKKSFINKVLDKYNSDKYRDFYYGVKKEEPREMLLFLLYDCAVAFGRECTDEECDEFGNDFSVGVYYYEGFYFNKMIGQGCCILVTPES